MTPRFPVVSGRATLAAEVIGDGDPVVFLHANICDRRMWRAQVDVIGQGRKAITYDRRGFGQTRYEAEDHSAVGDLMAVIHALGDGKPVVLVGCSQGARIAVDAALLHPGSIRALVLISASVAGSQDVPIAPEFKALMSSLKDAEARGDLDQVNALKARLFLDGPLADEGRVSGTLREQFLQMNGQILRAPPTGRSLDDVPAYSRLEEIAVPTRVMWGTLDFPHIQARCRSVAQRVAQGSTHEVQGGAHLPSLDCPADVTRALLNFLGG